MVKYLFLILIMVQSCLCGFERTEVGARAMAIGYTYTGLADDVWGVYFNVGGIASITKWQTSVFYSPRQYGLSELSLTALGIILPTRYGNFGFAVRKYGFELYREISGTLSYARNISSVDIGVNFNYHSVTIKSYGTAGTIGIDVGLLVPVIDKLQMGVFIKNINSPTIGRSKEKLPQSFNSGIAYFPFKQLTISVDLQKDISFKPNVRCGFEYKLIDMVILRGGVNDDPSIFSGGVGLQYSIFQFDYAFTTHQELGWTHAFSLTIK